MFNLLQDETNPFVRLNLPHIYFSNLFQLQNLSHAFWLLLNPWLIITDPACQHECFITSLVTNYHYGTKMDSWFRNICWLPPSFKLPCMLSKLCQQMKLRCMWGWIYTVDKMFFIRVEWVIECLVQITVSYCDTGIIWVKGSLFIQVVLSIVL